VSRIGTFAKSTLGPLIATLRRFAPVEPPTAIGYPKDAQRGAQAQQRDIGTATSGDRTKKAKFPFLTAQPVLNNIKSLQGDFFFALCKCMKLLDPLTSRTPARN